MKKIIQKCFTILLAATLIFSPLSLTPGFQPKVIEAHSGRTDSSGGHKDNQNKSGLGSYHYHCGGYPAHLHSGGVCPYSSASSASSSSSSTNNITSTSSSTSTTTTSTSASGKIKLSTGTEISAPKDMIKIIQDILNTKGYECGTPDGVVGEKTKKALQEFLNNESNIETDHMIISMFAESLGIEATS